MSYLDTIDLDQLVRDGLVKLEITGGIPTWEMSPSARHQWTVRLIERSIKPLQDDGCGCEYLADVYIRFRDGSLKRPDISIFCEAPPLQDDALTVIPAAVIEIVSPGYEYKDITLNPQFYLAQGVEDVVIVDPRAGAITHYRKSGVSNHHAPMKIELQCGCECTVPEAGSRE
jgi:Uma2 family endonuclease